MFNFDQHYYYDEWWVNVLNLVIQNFAKERKRKKNNEKEKKIVSQTPKLQN